jgi:hypothetical protein
MSNCRYSCGGFCRVGLKTKECPDDCSMFSDAKEPLPARQCTLKCANFVAPEFCAKGPCYNDDRPPICCFKCVWFGECGNERCSIGN